ncbi:hypothetical protein ACVXG8_00610 [Escherichia coli]
MAAHVAERAARADPTPDDKIDCQNTFLTGTSSRTKKAAFLDDPLDGLKPAESGMMLETAFQGVNAVIGSIKSVQRR